jgi:hypothetical protein
MDIEINKYQERLFEIRNRTDYIGDHLNGKYSTKYLITEVEILCVQFRKIIEEIAFASLVANKKEYSKQHKKFSKHWNVNFIFKDLQRINPDFYPSPSKQVKCISDEGREFTNFEKISDPYLTKKKALEVYEICGGMLHAFNPYKPEKDINAIYNKFPVWLGEIMNLLNHHSIVLFGKEYMVVGIMKTESTGNPSAYHFVKCSNLELNPADEK